MIKHKPINKWDTGRVKKGKKCPYCGRYYSRYLGADALVMEKDRVLLVKRHQQTREGGKWALPGGMLEWSETLSQAVLSELKEETGYQGKIIKLFKIYSQPDREPKDGQNVTAVFIVKILKKVSDKFDSQEIAEVKWFSKKKLPKKMAFDHRKIIKDYLQSKSNEFNKKTKKIY
jgi:8-oxo-dGTP diphosphatase